MRLIDGVPEVLASLASRFQLVLVTKGDVFDQRIKIQKSGLAPHFCHVEILSSKTPADYRAFLDRMSTPPDRFLMVGNSVRSDILPVRSIGAHAVHVPYPMTWVHEHVTADECGDTECFRLSSIKELPLLIESFERHGTVPRPSLIQEHALAADAAGAGSGWPGRLVES